jgi:hypothetical protein
MPEAPRNPADSTPTSDPAAHTPHAPPSIPTTPTVLFLAADLIWATRIKATAEDLGVAARPVRTLAMLEARLADCNATSILLDLEKPEEALAMIGWLRGPAAGPRERAIRIIAWGPHIAKELLQTARDQGADEVLTRGAFDANLPEILIKLGSGSRR